MDSTLWNCNAILMIEFCFQRSFLIQLVLLYAMALKFLGTLPLSAPSQIYCNSSIHWLIERKERHLSFLFWSVFSEEITENCGDQCHQNHEMICRFRKLPKSFIPWNEPSNIIWTILSNNEVPCLLQKNKRVWHGTVYHINYLVFSL